MLFATKLRPPALPEHRVRRPRLLDLLDQATTAPLTLVIAAAGSGKTSLLASWVAESEVPCAWFTVDETDADASQFWTGVIAALDTVVPGCGERASAELRRHHAIDDVVVALLADLEEEDRASHTVLVIDDVHLVDRTPVAPTLAYFVQHLPQRWHVVLSARRAPDLPVDRLRARGLLGEVHFAELRFSPGEALDLVRALSPAMTDDQATGAAAHADGWAAGLQLAALAARSAQARHPGSDPSTVPNGSHEMLVRDYLWHEVLATERSALVDLLLDCAVVERVGPSLARRLTDRGDAGELLYEAEARGLFITRLDAGGWFEIHSLVREILLDDLTQRTPEHLAELHARAAGWFTDAGEIALALEHWLAAGCPRDALRLLAEQNTALYDRGREATIARVLAAIPLSIGDADLEARLEWAWCHLLVDHHRFVETVDQITVEVNRAADLRPGVRPRLAMLQSFSASVQGDWHEGGALAGHTLESLGSGWWRDSLGRFGWNMVARDIALSERWADSGDEVQQARHALSRDPERRLTFEGTRALGEALAGRPVDALRVAAGVRQAAEVTNMSVLRTELALAEAVAHRELGNRSRASAELSDIADTRSGPVTYARLRALLELSHAYLEDGDEAAAARAFDRATGLVETITPGRGARGWLGRTGVTLALAAGDVAGAVRWCTQIDDPFWSDVAAARIALAEDRTDDAAARIDAAAPRCPRHEVVRQLVAALAAPHRDVATKHVAAAVEQAAAHGLVQTVASESPEVMHWVEVVAWRVPQEWSDRLRRAATPGIESTRLASRDLIESLTVRERDVLRFLPSRLTLREIADELCISMNTLKFHLKVIYRKLGCGSRAEAAEIARSMTRVGTSDHRSSTLRR